MFFFFFSSRRRHTRFDCDWSSDVCSSDLLQGHPPEARERTHRSGDGPYPVVDVQLRHLRSEEHTSELQSQSNLVCRLLLEKKKNTATLAQTRSPRQTLHLTRRGSRCGRPG